MLTGEVRYMLTHCHQIQRNKQIQQHVHCFHCISNDFGSSTHDEVMQTRYLIGVMSEIENRQARTRER